MKIYCPNCDSHLILLTWEDTDSYATVHTKEYECCSCGCTFEVNFIAEKNAKILNLPIDKQSKVWYNIDTEREVIKMIKCPHCGSTAQVKSNGNPIISKTSHLFVEGFHCGCGCWWEVEYARNEKGYWEYYNECITHIEKSKEKGHIHCPANGYDCPYWKDGICSLYSEEENWADPWEECSDFGMFWDEGDDYIDYD